MLLSDRGFAQIEMPHPVLYIYRWYITIHRAIGVYMHWVILGMELGYQALGYIHYKTTCSYVYTQQNTVPGIHRIKQLHTPLPHFLPF